jgi:hypothetical protein
MSASAEIAAIRKGIPLTSKVGAFFFRNHGVVIHVLGPLLRDFGKPAANDIAVLTRAFERCVESSSASAFRAAESAASRLRALADKLPPADRQSVLIEIERQMQTLQNKRNEFGKLFAESMQETKATGKVAGFVASALGKAKDADQVIATLGEVIAARSAAEPAIAAVWKSFRRYVPLQSVGVRAAAGYAAEHAPKIKALLAKGKMTPELWGHLVKIRGFLGEEYALANRIWRSKADDLMRDAQKFASRRGEGYEVVYLTQADHRIELNGLEGPDAIIAIIHREKREFFFHSTIQVKTADTSKGLDQIADGISRTAGKRGGGAVSVPNVSMVLEGEPMIFTAARDPALTESFYLINASESMIPVDDALLLEQYGIRATELQLDMSVDQFTHLSLDIMEAASKAF